jgi:hypothetical protein
MVHSAFGSNRPIVLSFLIAPATALVVAAAYSVTVGEYGLGGPASDLLLDLSRDFPVWRRSLGMVLILSNAVLLNNIFNRHDFSAAENYFPALVFVSIAAIDFRNIDLHPALFASLFMLFALRRLLMVYRAESALSIGFDSTLFLSLAVFFFPPAVFILPLPWIVFLQVRPFSLKEWLVPITAILAAAIYAFSFYFIGGYNLDASEYLIFSGNSFVLPEQEGRTGALLIIVLFFVLSILGLVGFFTDIAKSTLRKKSTKYIFLWSFFLMVLEYIYVSLLDARQSGTWLIFAVPVSVFMAVYFSGKGKRPLIRIILFYIWLIACASFMVFAN